MTAALRDRAARKAGGTFRKTWGSATTTSGAIRRLVAQFVERFSVVDVGNDDVDVMAVCGQSFSEALGVTFGAANRWQVGVRGEGDAPRYQLGGPW